MWPPHSYGSRNWRRLSARADAHQKKGELLEGKGRGKRRSSGPVRTAGSASAHGQVDAGAKERSMPWRARSNSKYYDQTAFPTSLTLFPILFVLSRSSDARDGVIVRFWKKLRGAHSARTAERGIQVKSTASERGVLVAGRRGLERKGRQNYVRAYAPFDGMRKKEQEAGGAEKADILIARRARVAQNAHVPTLRAQPPALTSTACTVQQTQRRVLCVQWRVAPFSLYLSSSLLCNPFSPRKPHVPSDIVEAGFAVKWDAEPPASRAEVNAVVSRHPSHRRLPWRGRRLSVVPRQVTSPPTHTFGAARQARYWERASLVHSIDS
ncbi:hypothetical protein MRX96_056771 [Rhipicephalus microplus]